MPLGNLNETPFKSKNKEKRHSQYLKVKKSKESTKRDERFRRKREEDKNPRLRAERRIRNVPSTIDKKRVWDDVAVDEGDGLGLSIDVARLKRQKLAHDESARMDAGALTETNLKRVGAIHEGDDQSEDSDDMENETEDDDLASILADSSDNGNTPTVDKANDTLLMAPPPPPPRSGRQSTSPPASTTSSSLSHIPDALAAKFPTLFQPPSEPKLLITTNLNSTLHEEAELLTRLFPNSTYIRRKRHRYGCHDPSLREIASGATKRAFTSLLVLAEDQKHPSGLTIIHLPDGPTFHFSIKNFIPGKHLPGHGNPTEHYPELILNNFRTPLGLLTASLFRTLFPPSPEIEGRQVVTLHNQRDYIFVRRHRYVFRDRKGTERAVTQGGDGPDGGKAMRGAEDVRAGLQELGPRFTMKLRRVDKGLQRMSGQEWEWKAGMEKQRTKFQL